jgi:hypothetical protein
MKRTAKFFVLLLAVFAVSTSPLLADNLAEGDLLLSLDTVYAGVGTPQGTSPWLTATFENLAANSVQLTMEYSGAASGTEYVRNWLFNFNPAYEVLNLDIKPISGIGADPIVKAGDGVKDDSNLLFDIQFTFAANTFNAGNTSVYLLSSTEANEPIDALSFSFLSTNASALTNYYSSANILGVGGGINSWIAAATAQTPGPGPDPGPGPAPVPEPATMILLGLGLGGLTVFGRKKFLA